MLPIPELAPSNGGMPIRIIGPEEVQARADERKRVKAETEVFMKKWEAESLARAEASKEELAMQVEFAKFDVQLGLVALPGIIAISSTRPEIIYVSQVPMLLMRKKYALSGSGNRLALRGSWPFSSP